jgi:hypothetical protein
VRDELDHHLGDDYGALADVAGAVRRALRAEHRVAEASAWRDALGDPVFRQLVAMGPRVVARQWLRARLEASCP